MQVHLLWHVHHLDMPSGEAHHAPGEAVGFDEETDDLKLIGVYSDPHHLDAAIERARLRQGFQDEPDCFISDTYVVDEDHWTDGFITVGITD